MPNNFKLRGDYYVSKAGNDSNDGLTPDTPKRTIQAGLNLVTSGTRTLIIGSGVYSESLSKTMDSITSLTIIADGQVVLDGSLSKTLNILAAASSFTTWTFIGIEFRGFSDSFPIIFGINGMTQLFSNCVFRNCIIKSTNRGNAANTITFNNCILVGVNYCLMLNSAQNADLVIKNSVLINCIIGSFTDSIKVTTAQNIYTNSSTIVTTKNDITAVNLNYNNIQGGVMMSLASTVTSGVIQDTYGRYYDLSIATSTGDGTIGNPYGRPYTNGAGFNFATHRILYPTFNVNSFSSDPGFNNILKQDFSLQSSSLMVGRANNFIDNIGGTYVATRLNASGSTFSGSNATVDNLVFSSFSDYVISGSAVTGSVTSAPIFISSSAKVIQEIDYNGLLAFNKDTTALTGSNVNVPDVLTYTSASNQPGANPDRLTYYMRWTTGSSQPVTNAQWENGGLWPAGSFNVFEWNTKPAVDFLGRGNGDQNFNIVNTPTFVKATWIQLRVSLRNDYLI